MTTLYTVARRDGENREYNLTLREAAQAILHHDGGEYDIRNGRPHSRERYCWVLWTRRLVAGQGWNQSPYGSFESDYDAAEAEIFSKIIKLSRHPDWRGLVAEEQNDYYRRSLDAMRAEEDDPEVIERIDAELAKIERIDAELAKIERIDAELAKMKGEDILALSENQKKMISADPFQINSLDDDITITVTEREQDTILAALRYWQREGLHSDGHEQDIATNGRHGDDAALTTDEIDALCEKINT